MSPLCNGCVGEHEWVIVFGDQLFSIFWSGHENKGIWYAGAEFLVDPRTVGKGADSGIKGAEFPRDLQYA